MQDSFNQLIQYIQANILAVVGLPLLLTTIVGIVLAFMKKVVFYTDFNDLALTAGMFALPALAYIAGLFFQVPEQICLYVAGAVFAGLLIKVVLTTWKSNGGSLWKTPLVLVGKVAMSFLFIANLFQSFTGKTRSKRGAGMFVLLLMTPLTLALVADHRGIFSITSTGRVRAATGRRRK